MDVLQAINERRSINFIEPGKELPEDKIREILKLAAFAPSSMNLQPWRVIVVNDPERKKALRKCAFDQQKVEEASAQSGVTLLPRSYRKRFENFVAFNTYI